MQEYNFTTPPAGPSYPLRFGLVADVGQTDNSSDTFNHLAASEPQVLRFVQCFLGVSSRDGTKNHVRMSGYAESGYAYSRAV